MTIRKLAFSLVLTGGLLCSVSAYATSDAAGGNTAAAAQTPADSGSAAAPADTAAPGNDNAAPATPAASGDTAQKTPATDGSAAPADAAATTPVAPGNDNSGAATAAPAASGDTAQKTPATPAAADSNAAAAQTQTNSGTVGQTAPATTTDTTAPAADAATPAAAATGAAATTAATTAATATAPSAAPAPAGETEIVHQTWPFDGVFGTYDRAALQRGFQVYKQVCSACHSLNLLSYRNLEDIGYTEGQVKAIAAEAQIHDGPNDEGEMFDRPGKPSDRFKAPFANKKASMAANGGAYPPDMSLLAKAREGGPDYIYAILTGFAKPPEGTTLLPGQYWNRAMPGHIIAMPPPLTTDGQVQYEGANGIPQTVDQYARDVAQFLTWASEPHMEQRKQTGLKVFLFLLVFSFVMYGVKKKVWEKVH